MTQRIAIKVHGRPAAQGSKRHVGGGRMVEMSKHLKPWREAVQTAALAAIHAEEHFEKFTGPVKIRVTFTIARPKSHYRSGRYSHLLKPNAPDYVTAPPDVDKLLRSTCDALTAAGVWRDDCLVVDAHPVKVYGPHPGAFIQVEEVLP